MKKYLYAYFVFFLFPVWLGAQIVAPDTVCVNTPVQLTAGISGNSFTWCFDSIDVQSPMTGTKKVIFTRSPVVGYSRLYYDNGNYYSFYAVWNVSAEIYRVAFGPDPMNPNPVFTPLSTAGMGFTGNNNSFPEAVYDSATGNWHVFRNGVNTTAGTCQLLRMDLGNSLGNTPSGGATMSWPSTVHDLGFAFQITFKKIGNEWSLFALSNWGRASRIDFGTSLTNTNPTAVVFPNPLNFTHGSQFSLYQQDGNWYMVFNSNILRKVYRYDFGPDLKNNTPTLTEIGATPGTVKSMILFPNPCRDQLFGYASDEQGNLSRYDFSGDVTNIPARTDIKPFNAAYTLRTLVYNDTVWAYVSETGITVFPLFALPPGSVHKYYDPSLTHTFTTPGTYTITLMVDQGDPVGPSTFCKQIVVESGLPPVAPGAFTDSSASVCAGQQNVRYAIPPVSGATGYAWSYSGSGATINGSDTAVMISFTDAATNGQVRVSAISTGGCGSAPGLAREMDVIVNPLPAATITPAGTASFCAGDSLQLSANTGTSLSYQWKRGTTDAGSNNATYSATDAGDYTVTVTDDNTGCSRTSAVTSVTEHPTPVAGISAAGPQDFCDGDSVVLQASPAGAGLTYQWLENGAPISGTDPDVTVYSQGNYAVAVTNSFNCTDTSSSLAVTVHPLPVPNATPSGNTDLCQGDTVVLTAGTGTGWSYAWKEGNTTVGTTDTYKAYASGDYRLVVTDANSCRDSTAPIQVIVYPVPEVVITPADTSFCTNERVTLYADAVLTALDWQWKKDGTDIHQAQASFYEVEASGLYTVIAWVPAIQSCLDSASATVTVHPLPEPSISWDETTLHTEDYFNDYQWSVDAQPIAGATGHTWTPAVRGAYLVTVTDSNGCTNTSSVYNVTEIKTDVPELTALTETIVIYPNPVRDVLHITAPVPVLVSVYTPEGKEVIRRHETNGTLHISDLPDGMYLLAVYRAEDGMRIRTEKLAKVTGR